MARIADDEIERIKTEVSLVRLVESAGVELAKRGGDRVGCCPFHDDATPSLVVTVAKNLWHCFGCDAGGDPISWVMKREGVSFRHAVELLRDDYTPDPDAPQAVRSTVPKLETFSVAEDAALLGKVADYYTRSLRANPDALAYLAKRGLAHPELIDAFSLGFADRTLGYRMPAANRKAGAEIRSQLQRLGVLRDSGHEHLRGSLVVPIRNGNGRVVNLYGRKIRDNLRKGTPDHLYLPGPHKGVLNLPAFAASEEMILAEAALDALTFWCAGYRNVTTAWGAGGLTDEIVAALTSHKIKRVLIAYDRDGAGDKGATAAAETLAGKGMAVYRVNFPKGMDANAYAVSVTPAAKSLGALLRAAEWMAGTERAPRMVIEQSDPAPPTESDPLLAAKEETPPPEPSPADEETLSSPDTIPEPSHAGPIPPAAPPAVAPEIGEQEVTIRLGDRLWRARGLARNASAEAMKINLMVRRAEAFHVDGLDLLSAKARGAFVAEAASELGLPADAIKRDIGQVLLALEGVQEELLRGGAPQASGPVISAQDEAEALTWLRAPGLMDRIAGDIAACGVVGEAENALTTYLAALSRKLERPLAVLIQSTSAAGKSALMDAVLDLVPEEERVSYSAMTGQSLFYLGEADLKHKTLAIAEEEGVRHASYALKLLQSQGTLTIASTGKDPATGRLVTQDYTVEGPVALMLTTTAIDLDEELANRCLVLSVDESRDQTRAIHARQRYEETLEGLAAGERASAIRTLHHNAQRLLKPVKVVNPYAEHLTFLDDKTRTRRDHRKYLGLIRAITLLHQHQRPVRTLERPGMEPLDYIEATLDDIAAANTLAHAVLGTTLDELPPQTRRLLHLLRRHVSARASAEGIAPRDIRFTRREVREATAWGDTQLKLHLSRLGTLEYVLVRREGPRFVYELLWDGEGVKDGGGDGENADRPTPFVMGLIDVERLRKQAPFDGAQDRYDADRSGVEAERSAPGRGAVGGRSGHDRSGESTENGAILPFHTPDASDAPESASRDGSSARRSYA
ncbi:CHC2 zinc finger domain-containing protein [Novosphingopyxis sp.]|uniref:CHC2 zinc finger domain-containing protein n=1 Tax=Novosphingopyxis sp. TaxID=2709690 RepID=UPI003B59B111